jgi:GH15 family glucan-1,4-alpha-glucosidase
MTGIVSPPNLDLSPIGNCTVSALIDAQGAFVWACAPRPDSDPLFSALLNDAPADAAEARGCWTIALVDGVESQQAYLPNTAILRTELTDAHGGAVEILDFCPRYRQLDRIYRPTAFVRMVRPLKGSPRIVVRLRPSMAYGKAPAPATAGSNHIRYDGSDITLRLSTNCPVSHVTDERVFRLEHDLAFFLGPDEPFGGEIEAGVRHMLSKTEVYWREWVRTLAIPLDWQSAVIRAAIGLKLCVYEETGAIIAAMTTSLPESAGSGRNWDYRYCWLRDAYYVIQALTRLGAMDILENYLGYLRNIVAQAEGGRIQPVYGVGYETRLTERTAPDLAGYRGMGPVRVGNQASEHDQFDVYGQIVLSSVHAFFDERLLRRGSMADFEALEEVGEQAFALHDQPDAGLWEFRTRASIHTYSAVMCWAACDRLGNAAQVLGLPDRADLWNNRAQTIRDRIEKDAWNADLGRFAASFEGEETDASLLQLIDLRFLKPDDPRHLATLAGLEQDLRRGQYLLRYSNPDDFGRPETAFNFCTFWFIEALKLVGRDDEARELFVEMLNRRTRAGLLSEDIAFEGGELWGNYPQTYSLVGLINCAVLLSRPWSSVR